MVVSRDGNRSQPKPRPFHSVHGPTGKAPQKPQVRSLRSSIQVKPLQKADPNHPTLRASPFPKVTDLICRLPLPILPKSLEAINLGDLLRMWVRLRVWINHADGFSRDRPSAPDNSQVSCSANPNDLISGWTVSKVQGLLKRKENSLGGPASRLHLRLRYRFLSTSQFRNVNLIPFRQTMHHYALKKSSKRDQTKKCFNQHIAYCTPSNRVTLSLRID